MKKLLSFILGVCLILPCAFLFTGCKDKPEAKMETWDGTTLEVSAADTNGVILIETAEELAGLAKEVNEGNNFANKTIKLTCDMDMANKAWTPIGIGLRSNLAEANSFSGTFDGNGKKIIGLTNVGYTPADENMVVESDLETTVYTYHYGFFGYATGATIKNLELTVNFNCNDTNLKGDSVGGIVGFSSGKLTIENCVVNGTIDGGFDAVGGIVGRAYNSSSENQVTITNSVNNAEVTALYKSAGILGYLGGSGTFHATIDGCVNNGTITANGINLTVGSKKRYVSNASGVVVYGWKTNYANTIIVTDCVNNGDIYLTETLSQETGRTNGHHYAYIATRVGNDFNGLNHSYKFENNTNEGKVYYLGEENSYVVCALVANNIPVKDEESGEYRYNLDPTTGDEYNNKTNIA